MKKHIFICAIQAPIFFIFYALASNTAFAEFIVSGEGGCYGSGVYSYYFSEYAALPDYTVKVSEYAALPDITLKLVDHPRKAD